MRRLAGIGSWRRALPLLLLLVPWLCCGFCALLSPEQLAGDRGLKPSADWSRGVRIGEMYGTDAPSLVVGDRNRVHVIWTVRPGPKEYDLHYVRLDDQGLVAEDHDLNTGLLHPRRARLLLDEDGSIHVLLLALSETGAPSGLFHLSLTVDGMLDSGPTLVSSPDRPTYSYAAASSSQGPIHVFWTEEGRTAPDLFHWTLGASDGPKLLLHGASHPDVAIDRDGGMHLLWSEEGRSGQEIEIYYAGLGDSVPEHVSGVKLQEFDRKSFVSMSWPVLALDRDHAYAIWTAEPVQTYGEPFRQVWSVSIGLDEEQPAAAERFVLPLEENPEYAQHEAPYTYRHMVPLPSPPEFSPINYMIDTPSPLCAQADEVPVAFSALVQRGSGTEAQIVMGIFAEGHLIGYQQAGKTTHWSRVPSVASDSGGNLHLSWVEGLEPGPSDVYYGSTSASVRQRLDRVTSQDLVLGVFNTAFGAAAGFAMMPLVAIWLIVPLLWVAISGRFIGEKGVQGRSGRVALAIGLVLYLIVKVYLTPSLLTYVPFSASVPFLPSSAEIPLQLVVPLFISAAAVGAVIYALRRVRTTSLLLSALAFMLLDALLTVAIYGPGMIPQS